MVVDHAEISFEVGCFLKVDPVLDRAEVVAKVDIASRLDAAENSF